MIQAVTIRRAAADGQKGSSRRVDHFEIDGFATLRLEIKEESR